jgi:hypothetical protein
MLAILATEKPFKVHHAPEILPNDYLPHGADLTQSCAQDLHLRT